MVSVVAGVPLEWHEGVELLADRPAPEGIPLARWRVFRFNAARLVEAHGVALHAAGWDGLDLFGLHGAAPVTNPSGWGVAWLLERGGMVLDVAPDAIGLRWTPDGARVVYRRRGIRAGVAMAWSLGSINDRVLHLSTRADHTTHPD